MIPLQQLCHPSFHLFRQGRDNIRDHVSPVFIFSNGISIGEILKNTALQLIVIPLDKLMRKGQIVCFQHLVEHQEMPRHFLHVFRTDHGILGAQCPCVEEGCRLFLCQRASLDLIGVVSHHPLSQRIDAAAVVLLLFHFKTVDQFLNKMAGHPRFSPLIF